MKQILRNLYCFTGLLAGRVYLTVDPDGLSLIDTSIPPAAKPILNQIRALGRQPSDVKRILITHAHPDHVGALPALKAATGAQVLVGAPDAPIVEGKKPVDRVPPEKLTGLFRVRPPETRFTPTPVDVPLYGGETLSTLGGLQVVFTPGHSLGHVSFWQPDLRLLVCGDVLFHLRGIGLPPAFLTVDMDEDKRSVRKLADLQPDVLCFGHGEPITAGAAAELQAFAKKIGV